MTGSLISTGFAQGIYLLKATATGDQLWERTPPAMEATIGINSHLLPNGEVITLSAGNSGGYGALIVSKFDGTGKKLWEQEIMEAGNHLQASALHVNSDASMIVAGSIQDGMSIESADILVVKLNPSGNKLWLKKIGGENEDRACSIVADNTGLILVGNTKSYGEKKGEPNIFLLRMNDAGDVIY
jgi:outer membrane protein assembly factor BamB